MNSSEFKAKSEIAEEKLLSRIMEQPSEISHDRPSSGTICLRRSGFAWCPVCEKAVELLSFATSAELFKTDIQDIDFLAKKGDLHRVHNRRGEVLICSDSLFQCFNSRQTRLLDSHFEMRLSKSQG